MRSRDAAGDEALRAELAADPDGSFAQLVLAYQDRIYSFALRVLRSRCDAEEAAQDAFVRAYRALRGYPVDRRRALALRPWLYRITLNVCRNRLRGSHPPAASIDRERDGGRESPWDLPDDERYRPEAIFERDEAQRQLAALLSALPERYRVAVVLRFVEGLSYGEVAATLKQPLGTVKANVHRGVRLLRAELLEQEQTRAPGVEV